MPAWNGLEVDMLSVGDADAILVTRWVNGAAARVLIDGGNKGSASTVKSFLITRRIQYLDHIVCTHPHDDHAAGLIDLVGDRRFEFGKFWMHLPWMHVDLRTVEEALQKTSARRIAKIINESLETSGDLANTVWRRKQYIYEPFAGADVGFLKVCGPSSSFYKSLVCEFSDMARLAEFEGQLTARDRRIRMEMINSLFSETASDDGELGAEPTEPENDSSAILATTFGSDVFVFTSDAGLPGLYAAARAYPSLQSCYWMQIPHHGSRRNVNEEIIKFFAPQVAFVSAAGTDKHPRKKVVNAFEAVGTTVFSTHYPRHTHLWQYVGFVPSRPDYSAAVSFSE